MPKTTTTTKTSKTNSIANSTKESTSTQVSSTKEAPKKSKYIMALNGQKIERVSSLGKIHCALIKVGILDGSKPTLIADIADSNARDAEDILIERLEDLPFGMQCDSLLYLVTNAINYYETSHRLRVLLKRYVDDLKSALYNQDFDKMNEIFKDIKSPYLSDAVTIRAVKSRIKHIEQLLMMKRFDFIQGAVTLMPNYKLDVEAFR